MTADGPLVLLPNVRRSSWLCRDVGGIVLMELRGILVGALIVFYGINMTDIP